MVRASDDHLRRCSNLPPPSAQKDEDQHDQSANEAQTKSHGRGIPGLETLEGLFPHQGAYDLARAGRSAAGDDVHIVEDQQRVDDRQQYDEHERRPYPWQSYVPELLPAASAVYPGGLVEFVIHGLQGAQEQKENEPPPDPDIDESDRRKRETLTSEERDPLEKRDADGRQRRSDAPFRVEDVLPDRRVHDASHDVGHEVDDPEEHLESFYLREQERPEQAQEYRDGEEEYGPDHVVPHSHPEIRVGEQVPVVLETHEFCRPDPGPIRKGVVDRGDRRPQDDEHVDYQQRDHEEPGC